jgi:hypothetical protein
VYPYAVEVSMPNTTTLTSTEEEYTTSRYPVCSTIPERSSTPLANICVPNSIYSATVGESVVDTANLTDTVLELLLQIDTVATVKVVAGTVYTVVFVIADKLLVPKIPVAIIKSPF